MQQNKQLGMDLQPTKEFSYKEKKFFTKMGSILVIGEKIDFHVRHELLEKEFRTELLDVLILDKAKSLGGQYLLPRILASQNGVSRRIEVKERKSSLELQQD